MVVGICMVFVCVVDCELCVVGGVQLYRSSTTHSIVRSMRQWLLFGGRRGWSDSGEEFPAIERPAGARMGKRYDTIFLHTFFVPSSLPNRL